MPGALLETRDQLLSALRSLAPGANVAMGDGSVRFLPNTVKLDTWKALCSRNGGEVVNLD